MKNWLRRIRGAIGMGLTWAFGWGLVGMAIEAIWEVWPGFPLGPLVDIWPIVLAIPGFVGGAVFSVMLGIAARHRRFDELSLSGFGALGALGGLVLGVLAVGTLAGGVPALGLWLRAAAIIGSTTLLSAASASGTLALARLGNDRRLLDPKGDLPALEGLGDKDPY